MNKKAFSFHDTSSSLNGFGGFNLSWFRSSPPFKADIDFNARDADRNLSVRNR
jgi:hypothetical protein